MGPMTRGTNDMWDYRADPPYIRYIIRNALACTRSRKHDLSLFYVV